MAPQHDFEWTYTEEPHATRRAMILKDHPEIKQLMHHHSSSKYYCLATVVLQTAIALYMGRASVGWFPFLAVAWIVGGTCAHSLTLAIHEMSHSLFFKKTLHNKLFGFIANWPLVIPYSVSFKKYHLEHHKKQGVDGKDADIPTAWEGRTFTTPFRKFLWVLFQPAFYALRPVLVYPKPFGLMDLANIVAQLCYMVPLVKFGGWGSFFYLALSTWLGLGLHPCAGHFIAEHYTGIWSKGATPHTSGTTPHKKGGKDMFVDETFTYRGLLNVFSYNVGIHVAHHDFPNVPGFLLPELEKMAPEYYDHLPVCRSWPGTIYKYIMSDGNPFDRVKRHAACGGKKTE